MKQRADILVYEKGLAPSREKAKTLIMAGEIFVGPERISKAGEMLSVDAEISFKGRGLKYVSRGGFKLEKILDENKIHLDGKTCIDIGASTGGFTDCMLQYGANKVYAIDVGYNQLDYRLRIDPRVVVMERTNIRKLDPGAIQEKIDFISIDVSFISLSLVLPVAYKLIDHKGLICALIKPQFEAGKDKVGKGGIVRSPQTHKQVLEKMIELAKDQGLFFENLTYSPIKGATGNIEFLMLLSKKETDFQPYKQLDGLIDKARRELGHVAKSSD